MSEGAEVVATTLASTTPALPTAIPSEAPRSSGLYAWWAAPSVLPEFDGPPHRAVPENRLLYVGLATDLRKRLHGNHMRRSGTSTLRRTLAGLLLDELVLRTHRTDRVVLLDEDEVRLTAWMAEHLRVSWALHPAPREIEADVIRALTPPLNVDHAAGSSRDVVKAARERYRRSAGSPLPDRHRRGSHHHQETENLLDRPASTSPPPTETWESPTESGTLGS